MTKHCGFLTTSPNHPSLLQQIPEYNVPPRERSGLHSLPNISYRLWAYFDLPPIVQLANSKAYIGETETRMVAFECRFLKISSVFRSRTCQTVICLPKLEQLRLYFMQDPGAQFQTSCC